MPRKVEKALRNILIITQSLNSLKILKENSLSISLVI